MIADSATDGPLIHSHTDRFITWVSASPLGGESMLHSPSQSPTMWMSPLASENQVGPSIPKTARNWLTAPVPVNRNRKISEMATEDTTDGK